MGMMFAMFRRYPERSALMVAALLVAGIAEGFSLSALLPLLSVASGEPLDGGTGTFMFETLYAMHVTPTMGPMLVVIVGGIALKSLLLLVANSQVGYTVAHVATDLRLRLIDALLASEWQYFLRQRTGVLANAIATEAYRAATGFEYGARVLSLFLQVVVYTCVAFMVSWQATLVALAAGALLSTALHSLLRTARRAGHRQTQLMRTLLAYLTDVLSCVKPLKAMARDDTAEALLKQQTGELEDAARHEVMSKATLSSLQEPILAALAALGLYVALSWWGLKLAEVMVLVFLYVRLLGLVNKMQRQYQNVLVQESAYVALRDTAEEAARAGETTSGTGVPKLTRSITLRNVEFGYGESLVFAGLEVEIPARSLVAIAAPSGSGKSTLLDLLCGLLKPRRGAVVVDGVPLEEIDLRQWRRQIGYVPQEPVLFHDSILNNVLIGAPDLGEADARAAIEQAGLQDFVASLPDGLDSVVGERGGQVSGGQRQRIAIARALAHRPRLLILDEPTSALDPLSEQLICDTLVRLTSELTVVVASHQPLIMEAADRIIYLRGGKAVTDTREANAVVS